MFSTYPLVFKREWFFTLTYKFMKLFITWYKVSNRKIILTGSLFQELRWPFTCKKELAWISCLPFLCSSATIWGEGKWLFVDYFKFLPLAHRNIYWCLWIRFCDWQVAMSVKAILYLRAIGVLECLKVLAVSRTENTHKFIS